MGGWNWVVRAGTAEGRGWVSLWPGMTTWGDWRSMWTRKKRTNRVFRTQWAGLKSSISNCGELTEGQRALDPCSQVCPGLSPDLSPETHLSWTCFSHCLTLRPVFSLLDCSPDRFTGSVVMCDSLCDFGSLHILNKSTLVCFHVVIVRTVLPL